MFSVTLCATPLPRPFSFAIHTFFLISNDVEVNRYEVWWRADHTQPDSLYLQKDFYGEEHTIGGRTSFWQSIETPKSFFPTRILGVETGDVGSKAEHLYRVVAESMYTYPCRNHYFLLPGPNSNTYVQWVLDQVPECSLKLPWNAFGKSFARTLQYTHEHSGDQRQQGD